ncbi:VOC family protein [Flavobacterium sp. HJJ]|uniref:VOC family protein n=1 Tax=Flavobacterium sp. HJJ TaxID=2783792 RepID=UPI00188A1863|nr:VOC family protein [Flavobacterium sp. HJJ]MBF4472570.1 VOC family protein [Flavobacterium sp. HJJ]
MRIDHLALWTLDLEKTREFYVRYFDASSNDKYINPKTGLETYFLSFESGARLEIMTRPEVLSLKQDYTKRSIGFTHFAFDLESRENVDNLTDKLFKDGYEIIGEPRVTGDGYYESVVLDPDGNIVELVCR